MGNAIADSTPWRRRITLYSWPSAAASSLLMGSVTLISALCSTQLKQPKPTSWRSDAGVEPLLATLHYCELMDFCANSPPLIAISSLPRVAESSLLCSPRVTLMLNNLPRSRPENPREIARCSMSAVQRSPRQSLRCNGGLREVLLLATVGPHGDPGELDVDPSRVRIERFVPLDDLLTGVSAVVAHGGGGTVLASLSRGLPLMPGSFCFPTRQPRSRSVPHCSRSLPTALYAPQRNI